MVYKYHIVSENKGKIKKLIFGCNLEAEAAASIQPFINADIKNMWNFTALSRFVLFRLCVLLDSIHLVFKGVENKVYDAIRR